MINGIRHNAAPLKHAKEYSSFKPVRATIRMQGHYVWCPMIYSNFYIKTLIKQYILRSTGIPTQQRNGIQILPELLHPKSDIYMRKYTPAQLLFILSKEMGGSSFLNNWIQTLISFMGIIPISKYTNMRHGCYRIKSRNCIETNSLLSLHPLTKVKIIPIFTYWGSTPPYISQLGMCHPKGYGFCTFLS